jgi:hypothetical protein
MVYFIVSITVKLNKIKNSYLSIKNKLENSENKNL